MKKTLLFKFIALSLFTLFSVGMVNAQALFEENFDYPIGALLTDNGWAAHSGAGTNPIDVTTGLSFTGYIGSAIGGAANLDNTGEDVNRQFTEQTTGAIYTAFLIQTEATNSAGYFFALGQTSFGTTFFTRVYVNATGDGVGVGPTTPTTYVPITPGTPTLLVIKLDIATKVSSLYAFNSFPTSEPASADATAVETATFSNVGTVILRQYNAAQKVIVDGIRVATTWDEAVKPAAPAFTANDLFFSEYIEGSSNNKAIEIFNGTGADVDLSAYTVKQSHNGTGWGVDGIAYVLPLTGTLANGDVYVISASDANAAILAVSDLPIAYSTEQGGKIPFFTGDDAMGLFKADVLIDAIGVPDVDPGTAWDVAGVTEATVNHTLIRKRMVIEGNTDWALSAGTTAEDSEWIVFPLDYTANIGSHTFGPDLTPPVMTSVPTNGDTDVAINTTIVLTFDEPIRNIDDSEITDLNVASLLTFKETDASGADVPFTATIDATKMVITVTPTSNLSYSQIYYGAIAPVEDVADNATTEMAMTFTTKASIYITFNVDMTNVVGFVPGTDSVFLSGNLVGWTEPGTNPAYKLTDPESDLIYTITLLLADAGNVEYKYFINAGWNTWGEWVGDPNRKVTIEETTTLNNVFGHYVYDVAISTAPFYAGDEVTVTWSNVGVSDVTIDAWDSKELKWYKMFDTTPSDGTETFTIPADAQYGIYYVRVSDLTDTIHVYANSAAFEIIATPTIYEIQSNTSDGDLSNYVDQKVRVSGIVTAVAGNNFWIQMPAGASDYPKWSGIYGYDAALAAAVVIGDEVTLEATIDEYYNATEIVSVTSYTINSQGNFLDPTLVSAIDAIEPYESTLVAFANAEVTTAPNTYGEFTINDGTANYVVDDKIYAFNATVGDILFISGVTSFSYGAFVLYPRSANDVFVSALEVKGLSSDELNIYPNPSNGKVFVQMGSAFKANTRIEVFNVVGMKVFETITNDFKTEIDLSSMKQGVYYVRVDDGANTLTQKVIKQ